MFEGRLPARFADRAPRIVENSQGHQLWEFDGKRLLPGGDERGGRPPTRGASPSSPPGSRTCGAGCWDIDARIADMDINGVWASLNFPSQITGFSGRVFSERQRPRARAWPSPGPGTTGCTRRGGSPTPTASSRAASPSSPTPSSERPRSGATPSGASARSPCPSAPTGSACPACSRGYWDPIIAACAGDRHGRLAPRRVLGHARPARGRPAGGPRRHPVRPDVADRVRRVALVGAAGPLPRASGSP